MLIPVAFYDRVKHVKLTFSAEFSYLLLRMNKFLEYSICKNRLYMLLLFVVHFTQVVNVLGK